MLNNEDIQKLKEVLATKEDLKRFATKEDLDEKTSKLLQEIFAAKEDIEVFRGGVKNEFSKLYTAIDAYAKKADDYFQEMVVLAHKLTVTKNGCTRLPISSE